MSHRRRLVMIGTLATEVGALSHSTSSAGRRNTLGGCWAAAWVAESRLRMSQRHQR
jgi:hypothetical protein